MYLFHNIIALYFVDIFTFGHVVIEWKKTYVYKYSPWTCWNVNIYKIFIKTNIPRSPPENPSTFRLYAVAGPPIENVLQLPDLVSPRPVRVMHSVVSCLLVSQCM